MTHARLCLLVTALALAVMGCGAATRASAPPDIEPAATNIRCTPPAAIARALARDAAVAECGEDRPCRAHAELVYLAAEWGALTFCHQPDAADSARTE